MASFWGGKLEKGLRCGPDDVIVMTHDADIMMMMMMLMMMMMMMMMIDDDWNDE